MKRQARWLIAILIAWIVGCGDSSTRIRSSGTLSATEREAALRSLTQEMEALPRKDIASDGAALLSAVRRRAEFSGSDIAYPGSVWARFRDGTELVATIDVAMVPAEGAGSLRPPAGRSATVGGGGALRPPAAARRAGAILSAPRPASVRQSGAAAAAAPPPPSGIPDGSRVLLLNLFAKDSKEGAIADEAITDLANIWSGTKGYVVQPMFAGTITLDFLRDEIKAEKNTGVVIIFSHGGFRRLADFTDDWVMVTDIPHDPSSARDEEDLVAQRTGFTLAMHLSALGVELPAVDPGPFKVRTIEGTWLTGAFVRKYWTFRRKALVMLNACWSGDPGASEFREGLCAVAPGAVVAAWKARAGSVPGSGFVGILDTKETSYHLVDALLGTGKIVPGQRALDYVSALAKLRERDRRVQLFGSRYKVTESVRDLIYPADLDIGPACRGAAAALVAESAEPDGFGLLAPSVAVGRLNDDDEIELEGLFDRDPGPEGTVTLDGNKLTVKSWTPDAVGEGVAQRIVCQAPGFTGTLPARVAVRGHESNEVKISREKRPLVLFATESLTGNIWEIDFSTGQASGRIIKSLGPNRGIIGIARGADGTLAVCEFAEARHRLTSISPGGVESPLTTQLSGPFGVCVGPGGDWIVSDANRGIYRVPKEGGTPSEVVPFTNGLAPLFIANELLGSGLVVGVGNVSTTNNRLIKANTATGELFSFFDFTPLGDFDTNGSHSARSAVETLDGFLVNEKISQKDQPTRTMISRITGAGDRTELLPVQGVVGQMLYDAGSQRMFFVNQTSAELHELNIVNGVGSSKPVAQFTGGSNPGGLCQ